MEDDFISKSQKKREAHALQKVGEELVALPAAKLAVLSLPDNLQQAIIAAKAIKSHGALKRQMQLIGKIMRSIDSETIITAYSEMKAEESAKTAAFHDVELWRERLITEGKTALTEFINQYPHVDVQALRQMLKKAIAEKVSGQDKGASRALFRLLRSYLQ
ncbi:alpha helix protein [Legionella beliardensis]|uniref:Dual-action ribosomal maturation protein DarP n=1 Tax=Legionella beliardensis TaxID=91822 RepID=A0A378I4L1_9GAMM|nr:ribosome biogenesis factor YjgA [Legionella beliardensis]STX30147.1 alpha helix protein [Legionella beliardensis]